MGITITNLKKKFEEKNVLEIENLYIEQGKIYCLVGPNGAGKSTLMKIISGIEKASSGSVTIEEGEVTYSKQRF